MEYKKESKELNKINYFKNIALKAISTCIKSYDSDELSEDEQSCLKEKSLILHHIMDNNSDLNQYVIYGQPPKNWYLP
jgi:hypothetical protein